MYKQVPSATAVGLTPARTQQGMSEVNSTLLLKQLVASYTTDWALAALSVTFCELLIVGATKDIDSTCMVFLLKGI